MAADHLVEIDLVFDHFMTINRPSTEIFLPWALIWIKKTRSITYFEYSHMPNELNETNAYKSFEKTICSAWIFSMFTEMFKLNFKGLIADYSGIIKYLQHCIKATCPMQTLALFWVVCLWHLCNNKHLKSVYIFYNRYYNPLIYFI